MDKTSQKVTKNPRRVGAARKGRENYMDKLKESILNYAKKGSRDKNNASNETTSVTNTATSTMALVYLLFLPWEFAYFLHITLLRLEIKNKSMKNRINHQNDVIYFRSDDAKNPINEWF